MNLIFLFIVCTLSQCVLHSCALSAIEEGDEYSAEVCPSGVPCRRALLQVPPPAPKEMVLDSQSLGSIAGFVRDFPPAPQEKVPDSPSLGTIARVVQDPPPAPQKMVPDSQSFDSIASADVSRAGTTCPLAVEEARKRATSVPLTSQGFEDVKRLCCLIYMQEFIRNLVKEKWETQVCIEGPLSGMTPWFYCNNAEGAGNNFTALLAETGPGSDARTGKCAWIAQPQQPCPSVNITVDCQNPADQSTATTLTTTTTTIASVQETTTTTTTILETTTTTTTILTTTDTTTDQPSLQQVLQTNAPGTAQQYADVTPAPLHRRRSAMSPQP